MSNTLHAQNTKTNIYTNIRLWHYFCYNQYINNILNARKFDRHINVCLTIFNEGAYLIWHLSQSSIRPSIYFSSIVKSRSKPFLEPTSTKQYVSCSRKQRGPLMGLEPTTSHYESDVQPTAPRRLLTGKYVRTSYKHV